MGASTGDERYAQLQSGLVYTILLESRDGDTSTISAITDEIGLTGKELTNYHHQVVLDEAQKLYIDCMANGRDFSLDRILGGVEERYRTNGHAGEATRLMDMWASRIEKSSASPSAVDFARAIKRDALRTGFRKLAESKIEEVRKSKDPAQAIMDAAYEALALTHDADMNSSSIRQALYKATELKPLSCGIKWIDENILYNRYAGYGGWSPTMMVTAVAPSENGKTSTAVTFASNWMAMGRPCIILSAEESRENLSTRMLCATTRMRSVDVVKSVEALKQHDAGGDIVLLDNDLKVDASIELISKLNPIYEISGDIGEIRRIIRRHRIQYSFDAPMLVIVDHLSAMDSGSGNWSRGLEQVAKSLKQMTTEMRTTMLVFAQAPGDMENEMREKNYTTAHDVRGSKGVRQWSDQQIGICRHNGIPTPGIPQAAFERATVMMGMKNRFKGERAPMLPWGVFKFDAAVGVVSNQLITDDWESNYNALG